MQHERLERFGVKCTPNLCNDWRNTSPNILVLGSAQSFDSARNLLGDGSLFVVRKQLERIQNLFGRRPHHPFSLISPPSPPSAARSGGSSRRRIPWAIP